VAEALSVMAQVFSFKLWHRRIFKMRRCTTTSSSADGRSRASWSRFWIAAALAALLGLSTLKLQ